MAREVKRCDDCKWYLEVRKPTRNIEGGGKCTWSPPIYRCEQLPIWVMKAERYVSANEGRECETWHAK